MERTLPLNPSADVKSTADTPLYLTSFAELPPISQ